MSSKFTQSFKVQAVEKALTRDEGERLEDIAKVLGVGFSTLQKWIRLSKDPHLEPCLPEHLQVMMSEKRPQDWSLEERLNMVIRCDSLSDEEVSKLCRERGLYRHHVQQWKTDLIEDKTDSSKAKKQTDVKTLKHQNRVLKREPNRKD